MPKIPDVIKKASQKLRKNMTISEQALWARIRCEQLGIKFLRQKPIYVYTEENGLDRFVIPDFVSLSEKLIIEVDGSIHNVSEVGALDRHKESILARLGFRILRFTNEQIGAHLEDVLYRINHYIK